MISYYAIGTCEAPSFPPAGSTDGGGFLFNIQYIIPTMNFTGCGEITDWTIVGVGGGGFGDIDRTMELQLFRPDPTQSTVFTKVTSSVVTTNFPHNQLLTHTFTSIEFTFSPGDVLGFYYEFTNVAFLEVRRTNSFGTHSVLSSINSPTASVVTLTATATGFPLMSVSGELSHFMFNIVHSNSVLYSHHCVCGYLLCVVNCTECPRSVAIIPTSSLNPTSPTSSSTAMSTSSASEYLSSEIACSGQEYM